jgi:RHH-type proline utilization regulon transcriptional repressor/proline dehydrogenase/delta 1-pyrroline-5-carboxylate dehydrogenase
VQAYGKRAMPVLRWLNGLAEQEGKRIPVRLVKGAYWDSEIKWAQERGLADYPVFTRKAHTDVSYLACMRYMLAHPSAFFPQLATHNAQSIASVHVAAGDAEYEFQRLHGMGEALYEEVVGEGKLDVPCRIYAPVGPHADLVAYLVRRLLENGANTSFVNRLADEAAPLEDIVRDPVERVAQERGRPVKLLPRPPDIYLPERRNSAGLALSEPAVRTPLLEAIAAELDASFYAVAPIVDGKILGGSDAAELVLSPHDRRLRVGTVRTADTAAIEAALASAQASAPVWDVLGGPARAVILERAADLYERDRVRLMAVMVREAGKTLDNALGDVREAVDFLRYYAAEARRLFGARPGTFRSPFSRARPPRRWRPATPCWPSPPSRRRSSPGLPSSCCTRRACRETCCICCPAPARSARPWSRTRAWPASSSRAPTRRGGRSTRGWRRGGARSCP